MWWLRYILPALALFALQACGFQPLYGSRGAVQVPAELASIGVGPIPDRVGQRLRNLLLDQLTPRGRPQRPRYLLKVTLEESIERLAVRKSAFATRANIRLGGIYVLRDAATGRQLTSGTTLSVSSYDILNSEMAALSAEENARQRGVRELSHAIRTRLALYFSRQDTPGN